MPMTVDWQARKKAWCSLVADLIDEVQAWAEEKNWPVTRHDRQIEEEHLGSYVVPELMVKTPQQGHLVIEPVGTDIIGAEGRVDISAFPSLNRMLLIRQKNRWKLKTDAGIDWPQPWGQDTFYALVELLTK